MSAAAPIRTTRKTISATGGTKGAKGGGLEETTPTDVMVSSSSDEEGGHRVGLSSTSVSTRSARSSVFESFKLLGAHIDKNKKRKKIDDQL